MYLPQSPFHTCPFLRNTDWVAGVGGIKKIQMHFEKSEILKANLTLQHSMKPLLHQRKISQADLADVKK